MIKNIWCAVISQRLQQLTILWDLYTKGPTLRGPAECRVLSEKRRWHQGPCRRWRQDYRGDAGEDKWGDGWTTAPTSTLVLMDFAGKRLTRPTWKGWSQATQRAFPSHFIYVYERQIKCKWSEWAPRRNKQSLDCWNHNVSSLERDIYKYIQKKSHQMPARLLVFLCLHTAILSGCFLDPEAAAQTCNIGAKIKCKGLTIMLINYRSKSRS